MYSSLPVGVVVISHLNAIVGVDTRLAGLPSTSVPMP